MKLLLSAPTKERAEKLLNEFFYSTTYVIQEDNKITWKEGQFCEGLICNVNRGRFKIYKV